MAELITLAAPDQAKPGTALYKVRRLILDLGDDPPTNGSTDPLFEQALVMVTLIGENRIKRDEVLWIGDEARTVIRAVNKADLRTNTLNQRVLNRLLALGRPGISGTLGGTID